MSYVYIKSEAQLWTTGFYKPEGDGYGTWEPDKDWPLQEDAAKRVAWLNGSGRSEEDDLIEILSEMAAMEAALKRVAVAIDLKAGENIDQEAYRRAMDRHGGGMAAAYIQVCEALGTWPKKEE